MGRLMNYPKPFWPGHFDDATWVGLLNWYVLRWLWVRLFLACEMPAQPGVDPGRVVGFGLYRCSPRAMYGDNSAPVRVLFELRLA
jgi:hypothetical protein